MEFNALNIQTDITTGSTPATEGLPLVRQIITQIDSLLRPRSESKVQVFSEYDTFLSKYPLFATTTKIDDLRATEYSRLDAEGQVYLDYTGGGLYADCQLLAHRKMLLKNTFGNPHSENPTSRLATEYVESTRQYILQFFNADPREYDLIFTANASGALKLLAESYPFQAGDTYLLLADNHNSINGIREFARHKGANVTYIPVQQDDMRADAVKMRRALYEHSNTGSNNLFAYPAQSNFSGVQHSLEWIEVAHQYGWDVVLDAAAYVPTNKLDLSVNRADYVPISFYKMFGYPTGIGALIVRKTKLKKLMRPWFAGGTVSLVSVQGDRHNLNDGHSAFEEGTVNYINIPALEIGLKFIETIGIDVIKTRVTCLTGWLLDNLKSMKHSNGMPVVRIYGPTSTVARGGTITLNFYDPDDKFIDYRLVEAQASEANISLRTGCFCNPGAGECALGILKSELDFVFAQFPLAALKPDDFRPYIHGKPSGAVRISVGLATNFADLQSFLRCVSKFVQ